MLSLGRLSGRTRFELCNTVSLPATGVLSQEEGRVAFAAPAARRTPSTYRGRALYQPMHIVETRLTHMALLFYC